MRVLLICENTFILNRMRDSIEKDYVVDVAYNRDSALYLTQTNDYSAVIIEATCGHSGIDCVEICKTVRIGSEETAIITIMEKDNLDKKVSSIRAGADAILTEPVSAVELITYVKAMIARYTRSTCLGVLKHKDLSLDVNTKTIVRGGRKFSLRKKEFILLEFLLINKGKVISKEKLLENIWDDGILVNSNTLEVHMRNLRKKIDCGFSKKLIKTVYGFGYKLE